MSWQHEGRPHLCRVAHPLTVDLELVLMSSRRQLDDRVEITVTET